MKRFSAAFAFLLLHAVTLADDPATADAESSVEQLTKKVQQSLVVIESTGRQGTRHGEGSGFAIADDLIVTARHVIGEGRPIFVQLPDERTVEVTHVHSQMTHVDLAVLRTAPHGLPILELGDDAEVAPGQNVVAMGHPFGLRNSVVSGIVSGRREIDGISMLQLAMSIEPGNSGGPVVDSQGRVLGIVTLKSTETDNIGFAVPVKHLRELLESPNPVPMTRWVRIGALDSLRWETVGGAHWKQRAGRISVDGMGDGFGGRTLCLLTAVPELPVEIEVDVRLDDERGAAGIALHADGDQRHYGFYPSAGNLRFTRFDGPDVNHWTILHNEPHPAYRSGEWNTLKVRIESAKIDCFVNGRHVFTTDDSVIPAGRPGYASFRGTHATFRNLTVASAIPANEISDEQQNRIVRILDGVNSRSTPNGQTIDRLLEFGPGTTRTLRSRADELETQAAAIRQLADDLHTSQIREQLRACLHLNDAPTGDERLNLLKAALLLARLDNEEVRPDDYIRQVDAMAHEILADIPDDSSETDRLDALNRWLFEESGFRGSSQQYYTRSNSYLNEVIDDREGLPVTLSVLYIELAHRLNLTVKGIGLPGHFIVRFDPADAEETPPEETPSVWIDVFDRGTRLTENDVDLRVRARGFARVEDFKVSQTAPQIIERMLRNLLALAEKAREDHRVLRYLEILVGIAEDNPEYRAKRLELRARTGDPSGAVEDADWFLDNKPTGIDLGRLQQLKARLEVQSGE